MAQLIVRNLDDRVVEVLKRRARLRGRSLEHEVRTILTEAAVLRRDERLAIADRVRALTPSGRQPDSTRLIRADRDHR